MTPFNDPDDGSPDNVYPMGGTVPMGINDLGQIVGDYLAPDNVRHGFFLDNGKYATIDPPGAALTVAEGISNTGTIVGVYLDSRFNEHGFVLMGGTYTTVDVPASQGNGTEINSINPQDKIVGYYFDTANNIHGFIGAPR